MTMFGKRAGGGRRSAPREETPLVAVFSSITQSGRATVVDLSATGVRLRGENLPKVQEVVELIIDGVRAFGAVMWSEYGECGIEFDPPLSPREMHSLRHTVARMAGLPPELRSAFDDWMIGIAR